MPNPTKAQQALIQQLDAGTAVEVGFAAALGKPIWSYRSDARSLVEQIADASNSASSLPMCALGYVVEDFGLSVNLMLASSARLVVGGPDECLREMKKFGNAGLPGALVLMTGVAKRSFVYIGRSAFSVYLFYERFRLAK